MDEQLSTWEERLRRELDVAVREVRAPGDLVAAVRAGGRRRLRRRRALLAVPAVVAVAGGAVWAAASDPAARPVPPAASGPAGPQAPAPVAPAPAVPSPPEDPQVGEPADEAAAADRFLEQYRFADAQRLASVWNVDTWEAKVEGGRRLLAGESIPELP
ncbi:hypothetical protein AB2L28_17460 [Kineococcus sp. TBRC 1896]|uniref:Uncharacterized protein n=1 Tax=Kineococcus mangrovi TaxID=1660183 RepID=A0ABV4I5Q8_9ACTN